MSKLGHQPYRSGKNPGWVKVKVKAAHGARRTTIDRSRFRAISPLVLAESNHPFTASICNEPMNLHIYL